ncbi:MAG: class I tRNA ligase family protein, partial [Bacillota bacterium]
FADVTEYREQAAKKSDFERTEMNRGKTGVALQGVYAVNPVNGENIPVWVSDYVLMSYGTGAIMAVPGHDTRDYEFAKTFGLPIVEVIAGGNIETEPYLDVEDGILVNSGFLNGLPVADAKKKIIGWIVAKGLGEKKVNYKLRDWIFSRQHYWGEPIPVVHCPHCGIVPVPEDQLPVVLPNVRDYEPTDTGESPLAKMTDWVNTACPACGGPAKRETDTMPNWAGSSWYFLRYCDPHNDRVFADWDALEYWMNINWYNGGMEHTTLHLLYSRFWHQFLYDIGLVPCKEPYQKRTSHGMILGETGEKMSKSRGNVINPDDCIREIGADATRMYEMFMGAFDQAIPWNTNGARGCRRFLDRVWRLMDMMKPGAGYQKPLTPLMHETIKKVGEDYEAMKYNTAIAQMMTLVNEIYALDGCTKDELRTLVVLLSPVAPHIAEEMWERMGYSGGITFEPWPRYDEQAMKRSEVEIAVQIAGKVRGRIMIDPDMTAEQAEKELPNHPQIMALVGGRKIQKLIFVPGRLCNLIVKQ